MSNRTDDLAAQARARAQAEQRARGSVAGNSDAAEPARALRIEQERKAAEREGGEKSSDESTVERLARTEGEAEGLAPTRTVDEVEESRETKIETETVVSDATPHEEAARKPSPGAAPTPTAPASKPDKG